VHPDLATAAAVRDAGRCTARLVSALGHDSDDALADADDPRPPAPGDLQRATALFNRVLAYLDRVR
jgi:exonuclease VII large subunit